MRKASRPFSLPTLGEFGLIELLQQRCRRVTSNVRFGIGDDAALLRVPPNQTVIASTDLCIEGIHFDLSFESCKDVGYRAAVANLSDIAAMGGTPTFLLVGLAIPPSYPVKHIEWFYQGLIAVCRKYNVSVVGGDTSSSPSGLFVCLSILGHVKPGHALTRHGAKVGDRVYVTGTLGDSQAGLSILQSRAKSKRTLGHKSYESFLIRRHLRPTPRLAIAQYLARYRLAHAAMDLSDGLSGDIHHLCHASQVGVEVWAEHLPLSRSCRTYARDHRLDPLDIALAGGEDYELLFTVPPRHHASVAALSKKLNVPVSYIGTIQEQSDGLTLKFKGGERRKIQRGSYDHFLNPVPQP